MSDRNYKFDTLQVHAGQVPDPAPPVRVQFPNIRPIHMCQKFRSRSGAFLPGGAGQISTPVS
jgi:O-acetylhomoserine/O-acetylserine sulfhydrylase-like pyridoxal-dependent enzyme